MGELTTPGFAREWAIGALCGAGLYTASAVTLMFLGILRASDSQERFNRSLAPLSKSYA